MNDVFKSGLNFAWFWCNLPSQANLNIFDCVCEGIQQTVEQLCRRTPSKCESNRSAELTATCGRGTSATNILWRNDNRGSRCNYTSSDEQQQSTSAATSYTVTYDTSMQSTSNQQQPCDGAVPQLGDAPSGSSRISLLRGTRREHGLRADCNSHVWQQLWWWHS